MKYVTLTLTTTGTNDLKFVTDAGFGGVSGGSPPCGVFSTVSNFIPQAVLITNSASNIICSKLTYKWQLVPQPDWDIARFIIRTNDITTFTVGVSSVCMGYGYSGRKFQSSGWFGPPGSTFAYTAVYLFPNTVALDTNVTPVFIGPQGLWDSQIVYSDPFGNPQPLGGVCWTTTGSGIGAGPADTFYWELSVSGAPWMTYQCYAYDSNTGEYADLWLDQRPGISLFPPSPPTSMSLTISGFGGVAQAAYQVLASTNLTTPVTNWTTVGSGAFSSDGSFATTVPFDADSAQEFYLVLLPAP